MLDSCSLVDQASCLCPLVEMVVCLTAWEEGNTAELTEGRDSLVVSYLIYMANRNLIINVDNEIDN
jgi:hypothetical protein